MDRKEMRELVREMKRAGVGEFTWRSGEFKLHVRFAGEGSALPAVVAAPLAPAAAAPAAVPLPPKAEAKPAADGRAIRSPIVGTFYRSPSPDAPVYINVGDRVRKGQVVCIVEAMKLMNQVESDIDGVVAEILVENAQPVQFGQDLFRLTSG
ncbi:MAG: acetyl-CoA carboxylase biotin carboxyl carrier protein [Deltaproteobacteria bacterium]|nr:acetyl-CoA carboxylase biotin carboxyl carrier protein [Deltaproteobacteria bacterium]